MWYATFLLLFESMASTLHFYDECYAGILVFHIRISFFQVLIDEDKQIKWTLPRRNCDSYTGRDYFRKTILMKVTVLHKDIFDLVLNLDTIYY